MEILEFDINKYDGKSPIIIYGAGIYGEYTLHALKKHSLSPLCFCDRAKSGSTYLGVQVFDSDILNKHEDAVILVAVGAAYCNVIDALMQRKVRKVYNVYNLIFRDTNPDFSQLSIQAKDFGFYEKLYLFGQKFKNDDSYLSIYSVDLVITERCSLRCKDCSNLMQYYANPCDFNTNELLKDAKALLAGIDELMDLRIIGGEPFMNKDMSTIIESLIEEPKINNISIYTNATILPNEQTLKVLKDPKVKLEVSDYGKIVKNFDKFIEILSSNRIRYNVTRYEKWHKLGELKNRFLDVDGMKKIFKNCHCNDNITLIKGKLYRCPYSANGRNLNAITHNENDEVDLYGENVPEKIRRLVFEKDFDYACGYCSGRNYHIADVEPAVQISEPLSYEHVCD